MKTLTKTTWLGRKLGLVTSIIPLVGSLSGTAANYVIVNETYDPPTLTTAGGWQDGNVANVTRQYVNQGVGHSTALQFSGTLQGPDYCDIAAQLFQSGVMGGNELATRDNTVLSFDIKIDQPGLLNVDVLFDGFAEYVWNNGDFTDAHYSALVGTIALGHYKPGVFKRIVLPLNDPRFGQDTSSMAPLFDPSARTYNNVTLRVTSGSFAALPASFTVTLDNVQIRTENPMVPLYGIGQITGVQGNVVTADGVVTHIGSFQQAAIISPSGPWSVELSAANGDKLLGNLYPAGTDFGFQILNGTGRFAGAVGSYRGWFPSATSSAFTITGGISTVGRDED